MITCLTKVESISAAQQIIKNIENVYCLLCQTQITGCGMCQLKYWYKRQIIKKQQRKEIYEQLEAIKRRIEFLQAILKED